MSLILMSPPLKAAQVDLFAGQNLLGLQGGRKDTAGSSSNSVVVDSSLAELPVTVVSNVIQGSVSPFEFKGSSAFFDSPGHCTVPNAALRLGSSDFTFECWVYPTLEGRHRYLLAQANPSVGSNADIGFCALLRTDRRFAVLWNVGGAQSSAISDHLVEMNKWTHLAATRSGNTLRLWVNGVLSKTATITGKINDLSGSATTCISMYTNEGNSTKFVGYLAQVKLDVGQANYTEAFVVPTQPLVANENTKLFLKFENAAIEDTYKKNNITLVGNVYASDAQQKFGNTSLYFDGAANTCLKINPSPVFDFADGDFTIECWFRPTTHNGVQRLVTEYNSSVNGVIFSLYLYNSAVCADVSGNSSSDGTPSKPMSSVNISGSVLNEWNHVALVRENTSLTLYLNGVPGPNSQASITFSVARDLHPIFIGARWYATSASIIEQCVNMHIDDLRITKAARYLENFIPPTQSFTL